MATPGSAPTTPEDPPTTPEDPPTTPEDPPTTPEDPPTTPEDAPTARDDARPARWPAVMAAVLVLLSCAWIALRLALPADGAQLVTDPGFGAGAAVDASRDAGPDLRDNDVVVAINGVPLDAWLADPHQARPPLRSGTELRYGIVRDGASLEVTTRLRPGHKELGGTARDGGFLLAVNVALLALGAFVFRRRPDTPAAQALLMAGTAQFTLSTVTVFAPDVGAAAAAPTVFALGLAGAVGSTCVLSMSFAHLALTFPSSPRFLTSRRWLVPSVYLSGLTAGFGGFAGYLLTGNADLAGLDRGNGIAIGGYWVMTVLAVSGLARGIVQIRRDPATRTDALIVAAGLVATLGAIIAENVLLDADKSTPDWFAALEFLPIPLAIAIALLRGQYLGIRVILNRALVFVILTAVLLGLYLAVVGAVVALVGRAGVAQALPGAAVVALAFAPARARIQAAIDRLLYGERGDPARVLAGLSARLEGSPSPAEVLPTIADTVAAALRVDYVGIATQAEGDDAERLVCERGDRPPAPTSIPLIAAGSTIGRLLVGSRPGQERLGTADHQVLTDVARHIAPAVHASRLLTELADDRSRLALAREQERAALRRELHDRLGGHLVGLSLQLESLRDGSVEPGATERLDRAHAEAVRGVEEVRRISRGLRPAELEELGLVDAIRAAAARLSAVADAEASNGTLGGPTPADRWRATVEAAVHLPVIPAAVEVAAYHLVLEALTNALRHSGSHLAEVRIGVDTSGAALRIDVRDAGCGTPTAPVLGIGLESMRERAAAVGGRLDLTTTPGGGTTVRADLPIRSSGNA